MRDTRLQGLAAHCVPRCDPRDRQLHLQLLPARHLGQACRVAPSPCHSSCLSRPFSTTVCQASDSSHTTHPWRISWDPSRHQFTPGDQAGAQSGTIPKAAPHSTPEAPKTTPRIRLDMNASPHPMQTPFAAAHASPFAEPSHSNQREPAAPPTAAATHSPAAGHVHNMPAADEPTHAASPGGVGQIGLSFGPVSPFAQPATSRSAVSKGTPGGNSEESPLSAVSQPPHNAPSKSDLVEDGHAEGESAPAAGHARMTPTATSTRSAASTGAPTESGKMSPLSATVQRAHSARSQPGLINASPANGGSMHEAASATARVNGHSSCSAEPQRSPPNAGLQDACSTPQKQSLSHTAGSPAHSVQSSPAMAAATHAADEPCNQSDDSDDDRPLRRRCNRAANTRASLASPPDETHIPGNAARSPSSSQSPPSAEAQQPQLPDAPMQVTRSSSAPQSPTSGGAHPAQMADEHMSDATPPADEALHDDAAEMAAGAPGDAAASPTGKGVHVSELHAPEAGHRSSPTQDTTAEAPASSPTTLLPDGGTGRRRCNGNGHAQETEQCFAGWVSRPGSHGQWSVS